MSATIVESSPILVCRLRSDLDGDIVFNQKFIKGSCSSTGEGYMACPGKLTAAVAPESYSCPGKSLSPELSQSCSSTGGFHGAAPTYCGSKITVEADDKFCNFILKLREPVADYLEKHGLPKNSQCSFVLLVTSLVQRSYNAALTILTMLYDLFPLLDGFVYLIRFILDKVIEICYTRDKSEKLLKGLLFVGELFILFIIVMAMFGLILMPVFSLVGYVLNKFWGAAVP